MSNMNIERRYADIAEKDGKLVGYAAVFEKESRDLGNFIEIIRPTAFDRTLRENPDILAFADHDSSKVLGRTTAGTLRLSVDSYGLLVQIDPPNTTAARDLLESVKRGDISGMSFGFTVPNPKTGQRVDYTAGKAKRELLDVDLIEVSVVSMPAYPDTNIAIRSMAEYAPHDNRMYFLRLALAELD